MCKDNGSVNNDKNKHGIRIMIQSTMIKISIELITSEKVLLFFALCYASRLGKVKPYPSNGTIHTSQLIKIIQPL